MSETNNCAICLLPLTSNLLTLKCSHVFHVHCVNDFRSCGRTNWKLCSLCRQELQSDDITCLIERKSICEICKSPFNSENPMYNLSCGHYFHFICMIKKNKNQHCYVCDTDYPEGLIKDADYNYKIRMGYL